MHAFQREINMAEWLLHTCRNIDSVEEACSSRIPDKNAPVFVSVQLATLARWRDNDPRTGSEIPKVIRKRPVKKCEDSSFVAVQKQKREAAFPSTSAIHHAWCFRFFAFSRVKRHDLPAEKQYAVEVSRYRLIAISSYCRYRYVENHERELKDD